MRTCTIKLEGRLSGLEEYRFEYPFGLIETISNGRWELSISAITALFSKNLPWNAIFEVSTNYIEHTVVKNSTRIREPMPLAFVRLKGQPSDKVLLGYKWRDYFEVTTPSQNFILNLRELKDPEIPNPPVPPGRERGAYVTILLIFRRIE